MTHTAAPGVSAPQTHHLDGQAGFPQQLLIWHLSLEMFVGANNVSEEHNGIKKAKLRMQVKASGSLTETNQSRPGSSFPASHKWVLANQAERVTATSHC